jgi:predicted regulator of Ras-like GTPase activity (Roadblock/LC7/MglB family)
VLKFGKAETQMLDLGAVGNILDGLEKTKGIEDAILISRSGMHIAGDVPAGAHTETFSAMFAILLGAAETATSELKDNLGHVMIRLANSKILVVNDGPKAIFVLKLKDDENVNLDDVVKEVAKSSKKLEEHL